MAGPVPGVCMLGPWPALVLGGSNLEREQAHVTYPTPKPDSLSAKCPQP